MVLSASDAFSHRECDLWAVSCELWAVTSEKEEGGRTETMTVLRSTRMHEAGAETVACCCILPLRLIRLASKCRVRPFRRGAVCLFLSLFFYFDALLELLEQLQDCMQPLFSLSIIQLSSLATNSSISPCCCGNITILHFLRLPYTPPCHPSLFDTSCVAPYTHASRECDPHHAPASVISKRRITLTHNQVSHHRIESRPCDHLAP